MHTILLFIRTFQYSLLLSCLLPSIALRSTHLQRLGDLFPIYRLRLSVLQSRPSCLPQDTNPSSAESIAFRRSLAQRFAQAALESVETDSEFLGFTVGEKLPIHRIPFHPRTPVELECIHALLILSNYEHAQRGNLLKMTARAGQALITAKNMSLHCLGPDIDEFSEAKRRAWWMTVSAQELLVMRETKLIVFLCSPLFCCSS
jgi:hypothetical protein